MKRPLEPTPPAAQQTERDSHVTAPAFDFRGPWFDSKTAAAYVGSKTVNAFYMWRKRHAIQSAGRRFAKADLDRALKVKRLPRRLVPAQLANLRKRWSA